MGNPSISSKQIDVITSIELFPFFRAFFSTDGIWEKLTDNAKMAHAFMLNRFLSIKYPQYIQELNKFHNVQTINALHNAFCHHGKSPGWMYTKVPKDAKSSTQEDILAKYPTFIVQDFINAHNLEQKSFEFLVAVHPDQVIKYLEHELQVFNQQYSKNKGRKSRK